MDNKYTAKMIDFGHSQIKNQDDLYKMAVSRPFQAPELDEGGISSYAAAKRTDVYSFGMLCFWVLFHKYFSSKATQLPQEALWVKPYIKEGPKYGALEGLKENHKLCDFVDAVLPELAIGDVEKAHLAAFLKAALRSEPRERPVDLHETLNSLLSIAKSVLCFLTLESRSKFSLPHKEDLCLPAAYDTSSSRYSEQIEPLQIRDLGNADETFNVRMFCASPACKY